MSLEFVDRLLFIGVAGFVAGYVLRQLIRYNTVPPSVGERLGSHSPAPPGKQVETIWSIYSHEQTRYWHRITSGQNLVLECVTARQWPSGSVIRGHEAPDVTPAAEDLLAIYGVERVSALGYELRASIDCPECPELVVTETMGADGRYTYAIRTPEIEPMGADAFARARDARQKKQAESMAKLRETLTAHPDGLTVAELVELTGRSQRNLRLHLAKLVEAGDARREEGEGAALFFAQPPEAAVDEVGGKHANVA